MEINTYSPSKFLNKPCKRNRFYLNHYDEDNQYEEENKINNLTNRLRTLLKLPKAHRWVIYEWFYSNLDQSLFFCNRPNDFQICLNDILPQLKTRQLRRTEWCQIRKLMGKPRRCSAAFLEEERETLRRKREKLREIYLNSNIENLTDYQDLPKIITLPLIVGSKCTALCKKTHEGLFDGTINAIDLKNGTYRVSFDKEGFGCENVYDYDIRSIEPAESMPLVAFESKKNRPISSVTSSNIKKIYNQQRLNEMIDEQVTHYQQLNCIKEEIDYGNEMSSINSDESFVRYMNHCSLSSNSTNSTNSLSYVNANNHSSPSIHQSNFHSTTNFAVQQSLNSTFNSTIHPLNSTIATNNTLNTSVHSSINQTDQLNEDKIIGNYPLKFLASIISFYKLVNKKSVKLNELKSMNTQAEFYKSSSKSNRLSNEFRNEYATLILDLEKIKDNLNMNLEQLEQYCKELKLSPRDRNKNGNTPEQEFVKRNLGNRELDQKSTDLITNLISILMLMLNNSDSDDQLSSLQLKIKSIKQSLNHTSNHHTFESNVEMHFNQFKFNYQLDKTTTSRLDAFHNDHL